jgi:hypothetical protein
MMTEELAAAGLLVEPEVQNPETAQLPEGHSSPAASGSRTHEDGEVRSEDEEVGDVDADVKDLIAARPRDLFLRLSFSGNPRLPLI